MVSGVRIFRAPGGLEVRALLWHRKGGEVFAAIDIGMALGFQDWLHMVPVLATSPRGRSGRRGLTLHWSVRSRLSRRRVCTPSSTSPGPSRSGNGRHSGAGSPMRSFCLSDPNPFLLTVFRRPV